MAEPELSTRFVWESGLIPCDLAHCPWRLRLLGQWPRSLGINLTDSHPNLVVNSVKMSSWRMQCVLSKLGDWCCFLYCVHVVGVEVCGPVDLGKEELGCLRFYNIEPAHIFFFFYPVTPSLLQCSFAVCAPCLGATVIIRIATYIQLTPMDSLEPVNSLRHVVYQIWSRIRLVWGGFCLLFTFANSQIEILWIVFLLSISLT